MEQNDLVRSEMQNSGAISTPAEALPSADAQTLVESQPLADVQPHADGQPIGDVEPITDAQPHAGDQPITDAQPLVESQSVAGDEPNAYAQPTAVSQALVQSPLSVGAQPSADVELTSNAQPLVDAGLQTASTGQLSPEYITLSSDNSNDASETSNGSVTFLRSVPGRTVATSPTPPRYPFGVDLPPYASPPRINNRTSHSAIRRRLRHAGSRTTSHLSSHDSEQGSRRPAPHTQNDSGSGSGRGSPIGIVRTQIWRSSTAEDGTTYLEVHQMPDRERYADGFTPEFESMEGTSNPTVHKIRRL